MGYARVRYLPTIVAQECHDPCLANGVKGGVGYRAIPAFVIRRAEQYHAMMTVIAGGKKRESLLSDLLDFSSGGAFPR